MRVTLVENLATVNEPAVELIALDDALEALAAGAAPTVTQIALQPAFTAS